MKFLGEDAAVQDQYAGMHRLQGSVNVERRKSKIYFRIRLAMHSGWPELLKVEGVLTTYNR